jgi:hypothetical protein
MADQITRDEFTDYMEAFEQRLGARFARADRRLDGIEGRLDQIDGRFDGLEFQHECAGEPPQLASHRATRDQVDGGIAQRAFEHIERLSAHVERCARLVEDLEKRLSLVRASTVEVPTGLIATQDTQDERMSFSDSTLDLPADPFVSTNDESVKAPEMGAARTRGTLKKANGTSVESRVAGKVGRKATRRETKPRAASPPPSVPTAARQRRSRT